MPTSTPLPTTASPHLSTDHLTVILASISSLVLFVMILVLLSVLYQKDPHCWKVGFYHDSRPCAEAPPQYCSSRETLVASQCQEHSSDVAHDNVVAQQPDQLFLIGQPSSYRLPPLEGPLPYLPSYESVRKKDRQRRVHMMIADRFGLNGPVLSESPPTYEESVRQTIEMRDFEVADATPLRRLYSNPATYPDELTNMVTQQPGDNPGEAHLPV